MGGQTAIARTNTRSHLRESLFCLNRYPSKMKRKLACTDQSIKPCKTTPCAVKGWAHAEICCYHPPQSASCVWTMVCFLSHVSIGEQCVLPVLQGEQHSQAIELLFPVPT